MVMMWELAGVRAGLLSSLGATAVLLSACASSGGAGERSAQVNAPSRSDESSVVTELPDCNVLGAGFSMKPLQESDVLAHTAARARAAFDSMRVGPQRVTEVAPALVTDPTGIKLGLPTTARIMWVFYGQDIYAISTEGPAGQASVTPGTVLHSLWLVDDETLKNGGGFGCGQ